MADAAQQLEAALSQQSRDPVTASVDTEHSELVRKQNELGHELEAVREEGLQLRRKYEAERRSWQSELDASRASLSNAETELQQLQENLDATVAAHATEAHAATSAKSTLLLG